MRSTTVIPHLFAARPAILGHWASCRAAAFAADALPAANRDLLEARPETSASPAPCRAGIRFRVRDAQGAALVGAPIRVGWYRPDAEEEQQSADSGVTDAQGELQSSLQQIEEQDGVTVLVPELGEAESKHELHLASRQPAVVELLAQTAARLVVTVVSQGQPLADACAAVCD